MRVCAYLILLGIRNDRSFALPNFSERHDPELMIKVWPTISCTKEPRNTYKGYFNSYKGN